MPNIYTKELRDDVLEKTMRLFWEKGFNKTSIANITQVTGFNRAAIYNTFKGKEGLFITVLERYRQQFFIPFIKPLAEKATGLEGIKAFLTQFTEFYRQGYLDNGCFLIATTAEFPNPDPKVADITGKFYQQLTRCLRERLKEAQHQALLPTTAKVKSLVDFLVGNIFGLMTMCRAHMDKTCIENHLKHLQNLLADPAALVSMIPARNAMHAKA